MTVDVDTQDSDIIETGIELDDEEVTPKLSGKEASQHTLEMRRKIEDRLERRRLKDQLGYNSYDDFDF
jgi:hypothetical protein